MAVSLKDQIREAAREYRWAQNMKPGMIIDDGGHNFGIERVEIDAPRHGEVTYHSNGRTVTVVYGTKVEIIGHFNP